MTLALFPSRTDRMPGMEMMASPSLAPEVWALPWILIGHAMLCIMNPLSALLLLLIFSVNCLAVDAEGTDSAQEEIVKSLGGTVARDTLDERTPIVGGDLQNTAATDATLREFKNLDKLRDLNLGGTRVTDACVKQL